MSLFNNLNEDKVKSRLSILLAPISDADPEVLSEYVIALLKSDTSSPRTHCQAQLYDFLKEETEPFIRELFDNVLDPRSYETASKRRASSMDIDSPAEVKYPRREMEGGRQSRRKGRCFDYDEKGVCLRGDACPYEHGADRIVVDEALLNQGFSLPDGNDGSGGYNTQGRGGYRGRGGGAMRGGRGNFMEGPGRTRAASNQPPFLVIEKIPQESCSMEKLNEWFKKFGTIVNIQLDLSMLRAVIQFTDFSAAKAAFNSPDAVFGNRFVKVYWHRVDEIPNPVVGYIGEGGVSSNHTQFVPQQQRQERVMPPPNTPMSINLVADKRAAMLVDLAEQKASLLARQIEHQKALLSKLESPGITDAERSEIMEAIRRSEEMGKSMAVVEEDAIDPALLDKLEMLKQQDGIDPATVVAGRGRGTYRGRAPSFRARGRGRGRGAPRGGAARGGGARNFSLDLRPTRLNFGVPVTESEVPLLKEHFSKYGEIRELGESGVEFTTRRVAEAALALGNTYKGDLLGLTFAEKNTASAAVAVKLERADQDMCERNGDDAEDNWKR